MLNKIKIGPKLIGGFLLSALILATVAAITIVQLGNLRTLQDEGAKRASDAIVVQELAGMGAHLYQIIADAVINRNLDESKADWREATGELADDLKLLDNMQDTQREKDLAAKAHSSSAELVKIFESEMLPLLEKPSTPLIEAMIRELDGKIDGSISQLQESMDEFMVSIKAESDEGDKVFDSAAQKTSTLISIFAIIGFLVAVLIGILLTGSITGPLRKGVAMMQEMAKGHLGTRLNMNRSDEIGILAAAMDDFSEDLQKNVVATVIKIGEGDLSTDMKPKDGQDEITPAIMNTTVAIRNLITEAGALSKAAVEGKLATRGDTTKYKGGYREIVKGVNDCLDSVIGPLNVAADYVDKISKGNIPTKITDNYNGDFNLIKNNLNMCIDAVNSLVADAGMLSKAAVEGKLNIRADASKHYGDYKKIVQGVNNTIDSVVGFLDSMPTPAMIIDKEFVIQYMNKVGATIGGKDQKQVLGTKCYDFFKTGDCKTAKCACSRAMAGNQTCNSETDAHPNGINLDISYTGVPIKDEKGTIIGAFEVVSDLTAIKTAQRLAEKISTYQNIEVQKVTSCLSKLSKGDLAFTAQVESGDEETKSTRDTFTTIANGLNECKSAVNALVADANMLSLAAVEGKLATRADASKHSGDFRKIVQGVDDCLDAVIGPLNVTAKYVDDISKGIIPPIITENYNGDFNIIKNNLNAVVKMMSDLLKETDVIIKAAADGELDKRANAALFVGGWNQLVSGVNDTITNIVGPLMVTADYVDKVSKGVIPPEITTVYKGQYNIIKNNLNAVVKMMSDLLKETDVIIKAAADGELDKRANAALFLGGWNQLVSGVNDTITNIVNPLMVTADYVDKVSQGVIPPEITTVYKGQYNIIKNNLNAVVKMMTNLLKETDTLVQAALGGALNTRAKADLFVGGWNELVAGVNKTLDAVLEPINEAAGVLEKVAARDMTARVKGDYKGDHAKIKISLNSAVDNLDTALTQVAEATEQVSSGSQQISAGSQSLAQGANEQASSLEEVSSSLEEMSSMTKQNAENANQAKNLAGEANENASQGTNAMVQMSSSINKIKVSSDQTAKIVKTIDEIAMQTNLLALNAAVEAARAGEAGRGFAVVAEEVRNLAQRSAEAAKNTANMIEESVKNAEEGVKISTDVAKSFDSIVGSVQKVNDLIAEIAAASQEQSQGIDQVNNAVAQMDKVTQQNAANSEESASAAEEMSSQAEELQSMIAQFALSQSIQRKTGTPTHQTKTPPATAAWADRDPPQRTVAPTQKNGSAKKHLKAPELAMAHKKAHAEDMMPMDDEVLKQF